MFEDRSLPPLRDDRQIVESTLRRLASRRRMEVILKAYAIAGAVVAALAAVWFGLTKLSPDLQDALMREPALLVGISGLVLSLSSVGAFRVLVHRRIGFIAQSDSRAAASFIEMWAYFEREAAAVLNAIGATFNEHSTPSLIRALVECEIIDQDDRPRLDWLLSTRNSIVHGRGTPQGETSYALLILSQVISRVAAARATLSTA